MALKRICGLVSSVLSDVMSVVSPRLCPSCGCAYGKGRMPVPWLPSATGLFRRVRVPAGQSHGTACAGAYRHGNTVCRACPLCTRGRFRKGRGGVQIPGEKSHWPYIWDACWGFRFPVAAVFPVWGICACAFASAEVSRQRIQPGCRIVQGYGRGRRRGCLPHAG